MTELTKYFSIAEAISSLLYPHAEVVIHDILTGRVASITNNFSKRKVGDESLMESLEDYNILPDIFPVYTKINWDGKKIKSSTATLKDTQGTPIGFMCINLDISKWDAMHQIINEWMGSASTKDQPEILFKDDWRERINSYVNHYLTQKNITLKNLNNDEKKSIVLSLHKEGAFNAKNAASYVAEILELSRATVYNYLKAL